MCEQTTRQPEEAGSRLCVEVFACEFLPWLDSWAAWESREVMLKADGPAVRILWSIDCRDA